MMPGAPSTPSNALVPVDSQPQTQPENEREEEEQTSHTAYAMLKFRDSYYYVKTPNVVLARDEAFLQSWKQAKRLEKKQRKAQEISWKYKQEPSQPSQHGDDDNEDLIGRPAHGLLSTYSEQGGAVSYADPNEYEDPFNDVHTRRHKHNSSSNQSIAPKSLHELEEGFEQQGQRVDSYKHDPDQWAQLAIHPAVPEDIKAISREHLVIRFDSDLGCWVIDVVGNGVILNDEFHPKGTMGMELHSGDEIMITSVVFHFHLPPVVDEDEDDVLESVEQDDATATSPTAHPMPDAVEGVDSDEELTSGGDDQPLAQRVQPKKPKIKIKLSKKNRKDQAGKQPAKTGGKSKGKEPAKAAGKTLSKVSNAADEPTAIKNEEPEEEAKAERTEHKAEEQGEKVEDTEAASASVQPAPSAEAAASGSAQPTQASPPVPVNLDPNSAFATLDPEQYPQKRKGPGRPPKNGLISKRDDAAVKRKVRELERAGQAVPDLNVVLEIVRAEQRAKDAQAKAQARGEAPPDMPVQSIEAHVHNASMSGASQTPGQMPSYTQGSGSPSEVPAVRPMSPKPRRIAKSPSPVPPESTFTEEELKKPNMTYIYIIDEILQSIEGGQADLQTIYDKIIKKWPYFKYRCPTNGWQSSVRHNLLQCGRFAESGKSGKGKYWKINWAHELDNKKRKPTPPPRPMPPPMANGQQYSYGHQAPFNANAAQGAGQYNSPYPGANYPVNGQRPNSNGPMQQNGISRPSSQAPQPEPPKTPFQRLVAEIITFQTSWLQQFAGQPSHDQAQADCSRALTYYSDLLHSGGEPDSTINEEAQPFKTMRELFMKYPDLIKKKGEQKEDGKAESGTVGAHNASTTSASTQGPPPQSSLSGTAPPVKVAPNNSQQPPSQTAAPANNVPNGTPQRPPTQAPAPANTLSSANNQHGSQPQPNPNTARPAAASMAPTPPAKFPAKPPVPTTVPPFKPAPRPFVSSARVSGPAPPPLMPLGSAPVANMSPASQLQQKNGPVSVPQTTLARPTGGIATGKASPVAPKPTPLSAPSPSPSPRPPSVVSTVATSSGQPGAPKSSLPTSTHAAPTKPAASTAPMTGSGAPPASPATPAVSTTPAALNTTSRPVAPAVPSKSAVQISEALKPSTAGSPSVASPQPPSARGKSPGDPSPAAVNSPREPETTAKNASAQPPAPAEPAFTGAKRSADDTEEPDAKRTKLTADTSTTGA